MKKKPLLIAVLLFTAGSVFSQRALSFVTINVWSGLSYEGTFKSKTYESRDERSFRYGLLVNALKELDADVISINEANMLPSYAKKLARDLEYDYIYAVRYAGVRLGQAGFPINAREGEIILAKKYLNLALVGSRGLSGGYAGNFAAFHFGEATRVLSGRITVGERDVYIFSTHWYESEFAGGPQLRNLVDRFEEGGISSEMLLARVQDAMNGHETRAKEAVDTLAYIDEVSSGSAAIIMGTLGALPGSQEIHIIEEADFMDVWKDNKDAGYTRDGLVNSNMIEYMSDGENEYAVRARVDYIFHRGEGLRTVISRNVLNEATYETHPSDHFGVLAEIDF
ncbi:MAG: hypothetical protein HN368_08475 [Spirochaetales bacterium]|jgi:endonuclease/exonuclease/phosphatase family metal-dependent hydrolase|nr:hypothetical protein [Spirochaetales bacterium]